jgi:hypothetical protein
MGRTYSFLDPNLGNLRLENISVQVVSPQIARMKRWRMLANSSTNADEVPYRRDRWHVWPLKWICQWIPRVDLNMSRISAKSVPRMLTNGNFRTIKPRLWYTTFLPRLIWPLIISSRSRELNRSYEGVLSRTPLKFKKKMADGPTSDSKKVGFSGISSSGRIAGPGVYNRKSTTLKVSLYTINDSLQQLTDKPSYANNDDKKCSPTGFECRPLQMYRSMGQARRNSASFPIKTPFSRTGKSFVYTAVQHA